MCTWARADFTGGRTCLTESLSPAVHVITSRYLCVIACVKPMRSATASMCLQQHTQLLLGSGSGSGSGRAALARCTVCCTSSTALNRDVQNINMKRASLIVRIVAASSAVTAGSLIPGVSYSWLKTSIQPLNSRYELYRNIGCPDVSPAHVCQNTHLHAQDP